MRRSITASIISICFVVCCASAVFASVLRQRADASAPQPATQAISAADVDFELRISPARGFLVRRKGTVEWIDSSKLREPVVVGLLDGTSKLYAPSKVIKPPKAKHTEPPNCPLKEVETCRALLHIIVDDKGAVRLPTVDASSGPEFANPSIEAVKKWSFEPARLNGQPVAVVVKVEMQCGL
jgi:Gram-negative bacterial TonB protein C-terminal